ncbi:MAG: pentafunctional AROM polypeptide [Candidatus Peregrinibacteria bacterium Greene0416_19]|nr:MAG: pentafunctional AROM polypeptide [Candidatus Peregrinibacteria bacterium Greene0416_19]
MSPTLLPMAPLRLPFDATLAMPGSKSHANRAIIAACLSKGQTIIDHATPCDDVVLLVTNLKKMGFVIRYKNQEKGTLVIRGGIPDNRHLKKPVRLYCGNAGTTVRFLTSLACLVPGEFIITGNAAMLKRPIHDLTLALQRLGAEISDTNGYPPVRVSGRTMAGGRTALDRSKSSQYLTSLLLIGPSLQKGLSVELTGKATSQPYIDLTRQVLHDFGVTVRVHDGTASISNKARYKSPKHYEIEGDWSAAGAFWVLAELTSSRVSFSNLDSSSVQADAKLSHMIARMRQKGSIVIDCKDIPDQVMNLAALAGFRNGKTRIIGAGNLRHKECDRIEVLTKEFGKAGIRIDAQDDGVVMYGESNLKHAALDPHDDHRMAFSFAILGSIHPGIRIKNPACVSKSYPRFFEDLQRIHRSPLSIAIVGMRGCGKSTLAEKLAARLHLKHLDTDRLFKRHHGSIRSFIKRHGWGAFRKYEEQIVGDNLKPGCVVSLGGGAIESAKTRGLLQKEAIVIHLEAPASLIAQRLRKGKRPALTSLPLAQEVQLILKKRTPLYRDVARIRVRHSDSIPQIARILRNLCSL